MTAGTPRSSGWLVALSLLGLLLAVITVIGWIFGNGPGGDLPVAAAIFVLPLAEIWRRRQQARGKEAFHQLVQLDDRVYSSRWGRRVPGFRKWRSGNRDHE